MSTLDRWIIGGLTVALATVLWALLLDGRDVIKSMNTTIAVNSNRLTNLEARMLSIESFHAEMRAEIQRHREMTESKR